jgi:hypothetical protein
MTYLFRTFGFFWLLPATILVWLFYILPFFFRGQIQWGGWHSYLIARFDVVDTGGWYTRAWRDWAGWSGPCVMITKLNLHGAKWNRRTIDHEARHCEQQFLFGALFYPVYIAASIILWIAGHHAYLDNPFERDARRAAGQEVDLPPVAWSSGDRWPWW